MTTPSGGRMKHLLKRGIKHALALSGPVLRPAAPVARILTYHSVGQRNHDMNVTPDAFRAQMQWLAANCRLLTLEEAAKGKEGVAVTFDDGFADNLANAAPVLAEFNVPVTVFMVAGRAGGLLEGERDPVLGRLLTWDELAELRRMGIAIGAHTMNHVRLSHLPEPEQRVEIEDAKHMLENRLGHAVPWFAYPFGTAADYTAATVRLVREAGYSLAVSNRYGPVNPGADLWTLRRTWVDRTDDLAMFRRKVTGRLDGLALLESGPGMRARRGLNRFLGAK